MNNSYFYVFQLTILREKKIWNGGDSDSELISKEYTQNGNFTKITYIIIDLYAEYKINGHS